MAIKTRYIILILVLGGLMLASCGGGAPGANPASTEVPVAIADTQIVTDGRLVPRDSVELAFATGGEVAEVLVVEGETVKAGDVIARLGNRELVESSVANAQLELLASQQELLAALQALDALHEDLPDVQTVALEAVTDARQAVRDAERKVNSLTSPAEQIDIDSAQASVVLAKDALDKAREDYEPYANKPDDNLVRAVYLNKLAAMQKAFNDAVRRLNNMEGVLANDFDLSQAQAELEIAQARLSQTQTDLAILRQGPDPDAVSLANSRLLTAQGRIAAAEAAHAAAQATLEDLDLVATINGTVVNNDLTVGEQVAPNVPVVTLADFSQWYVETDDLTEIEVVDVSLDQVVSIVADALPDVELTGKVESINNLYEERRGDITYTARILVNEVNARLRWGMTVAVTFEK